MVAKPIQGVYGSKGSAFLFYCGVFPLPDVIEESAENITLQHKSTSPTEPVISAPIVSESSLIPLVVEPIMTVAPTQPCIPGKKLTILFYSCA